MDYQPDGQTPYQNTHSQNMALASLILGTLALLTCGGIYFAVVCASLGIIFAL